MGSKMRRRRRISWVGLWVDGGVKALVQAVTWTCPDGMVSFPMTGTAYSRYSSSVQCSLQCILVHNLGACTSLCVLVQLGLGAVVLVPLSEYCVWLKLTVTVFDKCRHSPYRSIATNVEDYRRTLVQISRAGVLGWSLQMRNMKEQIGDWAHNAGGHSLSKVKMPASNSKICTKLYYESRRTFRLEQICFWGEPWSVRGC